MFLWQHPDWPGFRWDAAALVAPLSEARLKQGRLQGRMQGLPIQLRRDAEVSAIVEEAVQSSAIEAERLDPQLVHSSVTRRMGASRGGRGASDARTEGAVSLILAATRTPEAPLTSQLLCEWQAGLFPGREAAEHAWAGRFRDGSRGAMQVVSGPIGRQRVHFEAPPAGRVAREMALFLRWFNAPAQVDGLLRAALAHLWFLTIHPFEDGNGRVARAITERALAFSEGSPHRYYSLSGQLMRERADYYRQLERAQRGTVDVTAWIDWFLRCLARALEASEQAKTTQARSAAVWQRFGADLNHRQRRVLQRLLNHFTGKLTAKKWAALAKCSIPTAQRDLLALVELGLLQRNPGGSKNTSYALAELPAE